MVGSVGTRRLGAALTDDAIEIAIAEIRQLSRAASMELALGIGEIVFNRVFAGDPELMRNKGPKHISFRRLALHPDVPVSASVLWRSVATYELCARLPAVKQSGHLGVSHIREVLALPAGPQERLLVRADKERWTVAQLIEHVKRERKGHGGRPPKRQVLKVLDTLFRISVLPASTFADRNAIAKLDPDEIMMGLEALRELDARLQQLRALLLDAGNLNQ
jgi:hypothetical protein